MAIATKMENIRKTSQKYIHKLSTI